MSGLAFIPLGTGDAFSAVRYSSCFAVQAEGQVLLVDCPHPIRKMMREATLTSGVVLDVDRVAGVALTHLHADHSSGLEGLGYYSRFMLERRVPLLAHPTVSEHLWDHHLRAGMGQLVEGSGGQAGDGRREMSLGDYFDLRPLSTEAGVRLGPFLVEARRTLHHIPTTALRIRAEGRTLGISADTRFDPGLIAWLGEADLFIHETNHGVHTPYESLAALPLELRARMRLVHYPDDFDLEKSAIEPLVQGRLYVV